MRNRELTVRAHGFFFAVPGAGDDSCKQVGRAPDDVGPNRTGPGRVRSKKKDKFRDSSDEKNAGHPAKEGPNGILCVRQGTNQEP